MAHTKNRINIYNIYGYQFVSISGIANGKSDVETAKNDFYCKRRVIISVQQEQLMPK